MKVVLDTNGYTAMLQDKPLRNTRHVAIRPMAREDVWRETKPCRETSHVARHTCRKESMSQ